MSRADLEHAAELLTRLLPQASPGPWRDSSVDGNRYAALITETCIRDCDTYRARLAASYEGTPAAWLDHHPHDGYGGCLVAESQQPQDRRLMAVLRNVADHLGPLLEAVAQEDPIDVGLHARRIAAAVVDTHRPRGHA